MQAPTAGALGNGRGARQAGGRRRRPLATTPRAAAPARLPAVPRVRAFALPAVGACPVPPRVPPLPARPPWLRRFTSVN